MSEWVFPLLRCPACGGPLVYRAFNGSDQQGMLAHETGCRERYPVIDGVPRMLLGDTRAGLIRAHRDWFGRHPESARVAELWGGSKADDPVIAGFDDEWRRFRAVGTTDHAQVYSLYFHQIPATNFDPDRTVLDAGCGAGRWAYEVARRGPRVIAVDLGRSIEIARANTPPDRVGCVQADLVALPLAPNSVDWAYSLGVLHHTPAPDRALAKIVETVRPRGLVLLYLYYALDQRGPLFRGLFRAVDLARRVVSRQPRPVARAVAAVIAASVYWPLARSAAALENAGATALAAKLPLSFYRRLTFATMLNDSLDRFGTRLERRYTRTEMTVLMRDAGLASVVISDSWPFWHGIGAKR